MKHGSGFYLTALWSALVVCMLGAAVTLALSPGGLAGVHLVSDGEYEVISRYSRLEEIRRTLDEEYYQEVDGEVLVEGAIEGMMAALQDPYTFYYTPDEMERHDEMTSGSYKGVGVLVQQNGDGEIEIVRVYDGSPAQEAGLRTGDRIVSVDGEAVGAEDEQAFTQGVNRIRRKAGEAVELGIRRGGETFEVSAVCSDISISNVASAMLEGGIGYIAIYQFSGDDASAFSAALQTLQDAGANGLIIDLRNNPGGLLDDVVEIADELLPEGVVVYTQTRDGERTDYYSDVEYCDLPAVVLVNDMSASASEILAAAMQDYGRAAVVGTKTFGKGIVQTLVSFSQDGAGMQYTSSSYYAPSGRSIHGVGVTPDIVVESAADDEIDSEAPNPARDAQLRCAIREVARRIASANAN